ncbi:MAG: hypothetical protein AAF135_03175 [Bacteroidota bacterium]
MKYLYLLLAGLMGSLYLHAQQTDVYDEKVTSAGQIAATVSNLGIIGNAFSGSFNVEGFPSCEFPVGSNVEHLFQGGLWIGGLVNGQVAVTTGAVDDPTGYSTGKGGFEYTSAEPLTTISSLIDNPNFRPDAISHQDYISTFTDTSITVKTGTAEIPINGHIRPLGVKIDFRTLNWNFDFANFFLILNFEIENVTNRDIDSVFVGYWTDGVIRNVTITPPGGTPFFNKGGNGFIDSISMGYEFDATGDPGFTDSYIATKYLGSDIDGFPSTSPNFKVHFNTWQFRESNDPLFFAPGNDNQRYSKMSQGMNFLPQWEDIQVNINEANNRSNLIAAGPYAKLRPGEKLTVAFAIVCAKRVIDGLPASANTPKQRENLLQNAGWAQTAYNGEDLNGNGILDDGEDLDRDGEITRFILPAPPNIPNTKVVARDNAIDVFWGRNSLASIDPISKEQDFEGFRLYKTQIGFDVDPSEGIISQLKLVGQWDSIGNDLFFETSFSDITLDEPVTFEGDSTVYYYKYTFENVADGWQHAIAITAFDRGDEVNGVESLESSRATNIFRVFTGTPPNEGFAMGDPFVFPNPYYARADWEGISEFEEDRKLYFANLPERCQIRIYTAAGDLVDVIEHDQDYNGSDIRWFTTYANPDENVFSGGLHGWDLLSQNTQIIARGLYLFVVIDEATGQKRRGKFVIIK